jgi:hypothetical protein
VFQVAQEVTFCVHTIGSRPKLVVSADGRGVVSLAGSRLLADLADATGLTGAFADALRRLRPDDRLGVQTAIPPGQELAPAQADRLAVASDQVGDHVDGGARQREPSLVDSVFSALGGPMVVRHRLLTRRGFFAYRDPDGRSTQ